MMTADAPAALAFLVLVAKVTDDPSALPRLITAILPFTDDGKSALVAPNAQSTNLLVTLPKAEPVNAADASCAPMSGWTNARLPVPTRRVESTSTPGAAIATSGPTFEKLATLYVESTAATAMTPGNAAG